MNKKELLLQVVNENDLDLLEDLVHKGININLKLNGASQSALALAVEKDLYDLAKALVEHGADVNTKTRLGHTPLFSAKTPKMADLLIYAGADIQAKDKKENNILLYQRSSLNKEMIRYFNKILGLETPVEELRNAPKMPESEFWQMIAKTKRKAKGDEAWQARELIFLLRDRTPVEIMGFEKTLWIMSNRCATSDLWAAAYIIFGGCSNDAFVDFQYWLVGQGKKAMNDAIKNPETLIPHIQNKMQFVNYTNIQIDSIGEVAALAYEFQTGKDDFYKVIDYDNVRHEVDATPLIPDWEDDTGLLRDMFPRLFEEFWL